MSIIMNIRKLTMFKNVDRMEDALHNRVIGQDQATFTESIRAQAISARNSPTSCGAGEGTGQCRLVVKWDGAAPGDDAR